MEDPLYTDPPELEPVSEQGIDFMSGSFISPYNGGFVSINPEFGRGGIATGRLHVYLVDPVHGSSTFYIEMNNDAMWQSDQLPPFLSTDALQDIGELIERNDA